MTIAVPHFEENPCRPRHFKPPPCAPVLPDGPVRLVLETCRTRLIVTGALFAVMFAIVGLRLAEIGVMSNGGTETHIGRVRPPPAPPHRADIVDRSGRLLATTLDTPSLYANPRQMLDPGDAARRLAAILPSLVPKELLSKLTADKSFVWVKRRLTPREQYDVNRLGIPGLEFQAEPLRFYPNGNLTAPVVGYTGIDNSGFAGVERGLDGALKERPDALQLSIDTRLQFIMHEELQRVVDDFAAHGAAGIIMDVRTGEILALVSLPDFDPNHPNADLPKKPASPSNDPRFNKITLGDYEMGSVFKIFNTAMALDSGVATMTKSYDAIHPIHIGRFTISDYHGKHRMLTVPELFMYSSNVASARMAVEAGAERQRSFLARLGILERPKVELDEVASPHFPAVWREINVMTIAFGHGISVCPLQLATGVAAIVNGGILHPATLVKMPPGAAPAGQRVISPKTSEQMRKLMRLVVQHGTGSMAAAPGYVVGGKTGTAEKADGGHYAEKKLLSSFVGAFPMNDPKYLILTLVDEPHGTKQSHGYATAGWTVAPATSRIIQRIAPLLGVQPVDENSPEVTRALTVESLQGKRIEDY